MTKHTPGPWLAKCQDNSSFIYEKESYDKGNADKLLALVYSYSNSSIGPDRKERNANARLIAAAPELLEALKHAKASMENWCNEQGTLPAFRDVILSPVIKAIAKAEGEIKDE